MTADVVVIGGGIIGVSIAYHLSRMRAGRIILLERKHLAAGATGMSSGLVRMHYDNPIEATFAHRSFDTFRYFDELVGGECGFVRTGFVRIVKPHHLEPLKANVAMMREIGIETRLISSDELKEMAPYMVVDDFAIAAYEPESGYADPHLTTMSLAEAARRHRAQILQGVEVRGIDIAGARVRGVQTSRGFIATDTVVNAAGPWGAMVAAMAGLEIDLTLALHQATILETPPEIPTPHLTFIDRINGVYARPETGGLTLTGISGGEHNKVIKPVELDHYSETLMPAIQYQALERLCARIPRMETGRVRKGHVGVEGYSPDGHALLGLAPGIEGFYLAIGMSGHGFKEGPAIGQVMAELISNGRTDVVDIAPLRVTRFEEGQPYQGAHPYL
ncbi:MAG: FAD-binding oxidoreductase [Chloroflexi bacterium]|nr:FAD-binding oxidoreductase [Chloroflexota bacterium]